jgi:hypothetical protein
MTSDTQGLLGSIAMGAVGGAAFQDIVIAVLFAFSGVALWRVAFALLWEAK